MFLKPYQWIDKPVTRYEICRELRVRETRHTVMLWDKKYYDSDIGKFKTDKIHTIDSASLGDIIDDYTHNGIRQSNHYDYQDSADLNDLMFPIFIPKDNNFDEECRIDEEKKRKQQNDLVNQIEHEKIIAKQHAESVRLKQTYMEETRLAEIAYQKKVQETEERLRLTSHPVEVVPIVKNTCNVLPNKWINPETYMKFNILLKTGT